MGDGLLSAVRWSARAARVAWAGAGRGVGAGWQMRSTGCGHWEGGEGAGEGGEESDGRDGEESDGSEGEKSGGSGWEIE